MSGLTMLALAGLGIYAIRASFLLSAGHVRLGPASRRVLGHTRVALLGALLAGIVTRQPTAAGLVDPTALAVVAVAALAARRAGTAAAVPAGLIAIVALGWLA